MFPINGNPRAPLARGLSPRPERIEHRRGSGQHPSARGIRRPVAVHQAIPLSGALGVGL